MVSSILKKVIRNRLRISGKWTRNLQFLLLLIPILFINLGIDPVVAKAESKDFVVLNCSNDVAVLNANRLNESRVLPANKIKRISISSTKEIHNLKNDFHLKTCKEVTYFLLLVNLPLENYELEYLLLDLPPPSNTV
jgi:hypothetical protein